MTIFPIDRNLQLTQDRLIDIFILQWHTPLPANGHNWEKIQPRLAGERAALFDNFHNWLLNYFDVNTPSRPLFIVIPELSMPVSCDDLLDQIVNAISRPTVIIAGLEFLRWEPGFCQKPVLLWCKKWFQLFPRRIAEPLFFVF